jgi:hypothetical protein
MSTTTNVPTTAVTPIRTERRSLQCVNSRYSVDIPSRFVAAMSLLPHDLLSLKLSEDNTIVIKRVCIE